MQFKTSFRNFSLLHFHSPSLIYISLSYCNLGALPYMIISTGIRHNTSWLFWYLWSGNTEASHHFGFWRLLASPCQQMIHMPFESDDSHAFWINILSLFGLCFSHWDKVMNPCFILCKLFYFPNIYSWEQMILVSFLEVMSKWRTTALRHSILRYVHECFFSTDPTLILILSVIS